MQSYVEILNPDPGEEELIHSIDYPCCPRQNDRIVLNLGKNNTPHVRVVEVIFRDGSVWLQCQKL